MHAVVVVEDQPLPHSTKRRLHRSPTDARRQQASAWEAQAASSVAASISQARRLNGSSKPSLLRLWRGILQEPESRHMNTTSAEPPPLASALAWFRRLALPCPASPARSRLPGCPDPVCRVFAPGAAADRRAQRTTASSWSKAFGQSVHCREIAGRGAGNVAMVKWRARGLSSGSASSLGHRHAGGEPYIFDKLPYDPVKDLLVRCFAKVPSLYLVRARPAGEGPGEFSWPEENPAA